MFAVIDTETTGGNPVKDRLMEIAIFIYDGEKIVDEYSTLVNPETKIAPFIASLTGIKDDMVKDAPTFDKVADKVLKITEGTVFVAHNAGFDYSVIRREFRRLGIRFQSRQLCTVNMTQKLMPGLRSYSLGNLCKDLDIKIEQRHRAFGDARATVALLELLLSVDKKGLINHYLEDELKNVSLPSDLNKEVVDDLPEETGVYYLLDQAMNPLYIGRAKNIREKVIDHLVKGLKNKDVKEKIAQVNDVGFEYTGSELVAQLHELNELMQNRPPLNKMVRRRKYVYGIYTFRDQQGYQNFKIAEIKNEDSAPLLLTGSEKGATNQLKKWIQFERLNPALCGLNYEQEIKETPRDYNKRVDKILRKYRYHHPSFFIIGEGRSHHEQSVVWVEDYRYKGFGYFEPEHIENDLQSLMEFVTPYPDFPEAHRFIKNWLRKKKGAELIEY